MSGHECSECGRTFDTERGLSVHQAQAHGNQDDSPEADQSSGSGPQTVSFTVRHALIGVFVLGLAVGFSAGMLFGSPVKIAAQDKRAPQDGTGSGGSDLVKLQETEFPYGNVEAGVGSGQITRGNVTFDVEGEPYIGSSSAEVTAVSFEDFQCPFCGRYNQNAFQKIQSNYISSGKIRYYFKNFPLSSIHPWAKRAAIASECALNQDPEAFWVFKQGFFNNQEKLDSAFKTSRKRFDRSMKRWAGQAGLDKEKFSSCYDKRKTLDEVKEDQSQGSEIGVKATPTIFINEQKMEGAQPYRRFRTAIEEELGE